MAGPLSCQEGATVAKVKNISGVDRTVPELGGRLVLDGQVVEVPDERAEDYLSQTETWGKPTAKRGED